MIRDATPNDAEAIARIYNYFIEHTIVTFEETPVSAEEMSQRIRTATEGLPWYVFEEGGTIMGYAYAGKWHGRCAYRFSAESTVYLDHQEKGRGIGSALYKKLLTELKARSFHTVIGGIAIPNPASIALHEKFGFVKAAHYKEVGFKFGNWVDVGYWQLKL